MIEISLKVTINLNLVTLHNRLERLQWIVAYCDYWFEHNVQTMSKTMYGAITSVNLYSALHTFLKRTRKWNFQKKMNALVYYFKVYSLFRMRTPTFTHAYHHDKINRHVSNTTSYTKDCASMAASLRRFSLAEYNNYVCFIMIQITSTTTTV